jgi:hypothetical protein
MYLFAKISRVSMITALCISSAARFVTALPRGGLEAALKDAFSYGMLITLSLGLALSIVWAAVSAVQGMRHKT